MTAARMFPHLGVRVDAQGEVREITGGLMRPRNLGPLASAQAEVTDGTRVSRVAGAAAGGVLLGPPGLLVGLSSKPKARAFVVGSGGIHEQRVSGNRKVRAAQAEAVRFNYEAGRAALEPPRERPVPVPGSREARQAARDQNRANFDQIRRDIELHGKQEAVRLARERAANGEAGPVAAEREAARQEKLRARDAAD